MITPRVVSASEEYSALDFRRLPGQPVRVVADAGEFFFSLGESLAVTQGALVDAPLPTFSAQDELAVLDAWAEKVVLARGTLPATWRELAAVLAGTATTLEADTPVGTHRDLHDGQLLDIDGIPGLIDFDLACLADACLDPANLLAHLELRLLQELPGVTRASVDICSEALLEGIGGLQRKAWPRLRFYQSTAFLRLALVYALRPRWQHLSDPLVLFAKRCLADLVRIP